MHNTEVARYVAVWDLDSIRVNDASSFSTGARRQNVNPTPTVKRCCRNFDGVPARKKLES